MKTNELSSLIMPDVFFSSWLRVMYFMIRHKPDLPLSDSNWTWTHNQLVHKQTRNHLAKLAQWLSCIVSTYLYGAFDFMLLLCHVRVLEWIYTLYFALMSSNSLLLS